MIDISLNNLNKYYGSNHVLKGISFDINGGEKVGLLGKNGSGKTTLFKTITGKEYYESGNISIATGKKVELLAQNPIFAENETTDDILHSSFVEINNVFTAMKEIEGEENAKVLKRYGRLMDEYERLGGYDMELRLDKVCNGMNIDERLRKSLFSQLSGGEKSRVNLARILLRECDILLLDEPTNHLDLASLEWLEKFLYDFPGTVVVISHDRVFLDNVVNRIIEVENGEVDFYSGNYSFYVEEKQCRFTFQLEQYQRQQKEIKRIEDRAKWFLEQERFTTKHKAILSRIDHMETVEKPNTTRKLTAEFSSGGYAAKEIVTFHSVCKGYDERVLFNNLNLQIYRNDCIALVGANGCGKTTLMKIIMGEEEPDKGELKISSNVKYGYMPQVINFDDEKATVLDTFRNDTDTTEEKARSILARFHFITNDVYKVVEKLSGGEKSRLKLCLLMQKNINFLLLDEPTNHLDIASREWIENALCEFDGTILFISHDRYFLRKFADKIWSINMGEITSYDNNFDEYLEIQHSQQEKVVSVNNRIKKQKVKRTDLKDGLEAVKHNGNALLVEELIIEAESELKKLEAEIEADILKGNFLKMDVLHEQKNKISERIDTLYNEWEACMISK